MFPAYSVGGRWEGGRRHRRSLCDRHSVRTVAGRGNTHFGPSGPAIIAPCPHRTSSALVPNIESRGNGNTEAAVFPKEQIVPTVRSMVRIVVGR